jgi:hypothetical protein
MFRVFRTIGAALLLASCDAADSDTLQKFGAYQKIHGAWLERIDPLVGPRKFLSYDILSDDKRATLSLGCSDKKFVATVSVNGAGVMLFNTRAIVGIGRDEEWKNEPFTVLAGKTDLRPGLATSEDALGFIRSLRGKHRLGFKIRSLAGISTADLPLNFDVTHIGVVAHNLEVACKKAG